VKRPADLLFGNLGYKLVSVLFALVLWMAAQGFRSVEGSFDLPVAFIDMPEAFVVVDQSSSEVNVRVVGSRAALRRFEREVKNYPVSLRDASAKDLELLIPIDVERIKLPRGARIAARSPSSVAVELESVVRKRVPVRADVQGEPGPDLELRGVRVDPPEIVVEGARSSVDRIREVWTDRVELGRFTSSESRDVPLVFSQSHVWRADQEGMPVRVSVVVEPRSSGSAETGPAPEPEGPAAPRRERG
jgi:YbbR domain-containing protein